MEKNEIPSELAKIRDQKAAQFEFGVPSFSYVAGFNDAISLVRQHTIDELAARAPEFDEKGAQIKATQFVMNAPSMKFDIASNIHGRRDQHQQTSLHYEAVIEKLIEGVNQIITDPVLSSHKAIAHWEALKDEIERLKNESK